MAHHIICPTKLLHPLAKPPTRSNAMAGGHDIFCVAGLQGIDEEVHSPSQLREWAKMEQEGGVDLFPSESFLFRSGFVQAIDPDYVCLLWDRSGMGGKKKVHRLAGVIDPDYRGEWFVRLVNHSYETVRVNVGDKIVQGIYQERVLAKCPVVDQLDETIRGTGGFGSTGD